MVIALTTAFQPSTLQHAGGPRAVVVTGEHHGCKSEKTKLSANFSADATSHANTTKPCVLLVNLHKAQVRCEHSEAGMAP